MTGAISELIDRKGLAGLGFTRRSIDHLFVKLPVVAFPDSRKVYLRREDVTRYVQEHTYDGRTRVRPIL